MPGRDGTGPAGRGSAGGGGAGRGRGMGGGFAGPGGYCVCPKCGERQPHRRGTPCSSVVCPKCGMKMTRDR